MTGSPSFGLFLPPMRMSFATIEERVRTAEEAGFHSAWFMDHMAPPAAPQHDVFECWTLATALAARTTTIRLGSMVACASFRHPALLAKMVSTLDVISEGRVDLGIGWGSVPEELATWGFGEEPAAVRAARLAEQLDVIEALFTGEPVDHEGRFYRLQGAMMRPRPVNGRVPVHVGGGGPKLTMPIVARYADWWNCPTYAFDRLDELRPLAGDARVSVQHPVGLAPDSASRDEVVALAERRFGTWGGLIAGTPDEVAEALGREAAAGVELFILQFTDFGTPETLRLFAAEVVPAIAQRAMAAGGS